MTPLALLTTLENLGVQVAAAGDRLRYRAPEGKLTPNLREYLAKYRSELLALLNEHEIVATESRCDTRTSFPLSSAQRRLWFMDQLVPDSALYNESIALRLNGILNQTSLRQSLTELVRRHEILRTRFEAVDGEPYQFVSSQVKLEHGTADLSAFPELKRNEIASQLAREAAGRPFTLGELPLVRSKLLSLASGEHVLLLTLHHIICDGWSKAVLIKELGELYASYAGGKASSLDEPLLQYSDFALWQNQRIKAGEVNDELEYWREQLGGSFPVLDFSMNHTRPSNPTYKGASCSFKLGSHLCESFRGLSRACGVTMATGLLAAFQILLGRYCGKEELVLGMVVANRGRAELQGIIGLMVNTLPIAADLRGNPTFKQLIIRVGDCVRGAYEHQEVPYEKLVAELAPSGNKAHRPLFEVMLVMEAGLGGSVELSGLKVTEEKIDTKMAKYDLLLAFRDNDGGFEGRIEYNIDLFNAHGMRRLAKSFEELLNAVVLNPDRPMSELSLVSEAEQEALLIEWNDTETEPGGQNVHEVFEAQVEAVPERIAVSFEGQHLTYRTLNHSANQFAAFLVDNGVGPDTLVAMCLERSSHLPVGVLGVLKAGGAYVALDRSYPLERLAFMVEDTRAELLLTESNLLGNLPEHCRTVCIDSARLEIQRHGYENLKTRACGEDLAYVVYTSGSTGKPKGVCMPHRAVSGLIRWHCSGFSDNPRVLQFASLSFDVSFYEMFGAWASGGTLFIVPEELRRDCSMLAEFVSANNVEEAVFPVGVLQQLAEDHRSHRRNFSSLRRIITTGEQLQVTSAMVEFFRDFERCSLHNHYGPSESHVVTAHALKGTADDLTAYPPIGRPIANAKMYVLDRCLSPVPIGAIGELNIGGVGLARGYLNRADLTAERFLPSPFGGQGERLYKTGDLARYLEDGNIDFRGRIDHQVKVRGFRVEPGEIETTLERHAAVRAAAVLAREGVAGDQRLVAYVTCDPNRVATPPELIEYSKRWLPDYMVPSALIILDKLPVTHNGKLDRKALESYEVWFEQPDRIILPRTPAEELIAEIWGEVLGVEQTGIETNFFDLGGHSLLAARIILKLREIFRVEIPVRSLFDRPTVCGIVDELSRLLGGVEVLEEIAWTFLQTRELSDSDVRKILEG